MQFATVQPVLARTNLPVITDEEAAALARTTVNLFRAWELTDADYMSSKRKYAKWRNGLTSDVMQEHLRLPQVAIGQMS